MARRSRAWIRVPRPVRPPETEKRAIAATCDAFIATVLIPRCLPVIRPNEYNYPVALFGAWHGSAYRFIQRWRSDGQNTLPGEFDQPFARIVYLGPGRFDLSWFRHTGQWWPMGSGLTPAEALAEIESNPVLHPIPGA